METERKDSKIDLISESNEACMPSAGNTVKEKKNSELSMKTTKFNIAQWLEFLSGMDSPHEEARDEDDLYLIKQYARLRLSNIIQLQRDYKVTFNRTCPMGLTCDQIISKLMERYHKDLQTPINPETHLPRHRHPIDFNEDALRNRSRGELVRLVPGTVIERDNHGNTYVVYCRKGYYEYSGRMYHSLSKIAREITGTYCSGPVFFSTKAKMYMLDSYAIPKHKLTEVKD